MNNLSNVPDNLVEFPNTSEVFVEACNTDDIEYEKGSIEYHQNRGLDLFQSNQNLADTQLLVDNQGEIIRIDTEKFMLDGHSNISKLITSPSNSEELIRAREGILDDINDLPQTLRKRLYRSREEVLKLNGFRDTFDHFEDLGTIIGELEGFKLSKNFGLTNEYTAISIIFGSSAAEMENSRDMIPGHLQLIRNIGGDFFDKTAEKLSLLFKKANNFSLADLKKIFEEKDYDAFSNLKANIEEFCTAYSHWDGIMIAAYWAKEGYIQTVKKNENQDEKALQLRDSRPLLSGNVDDFFSHIENDLPSENNIEIYSGGNGSGKSTWLKSRLMSQLFFQTYGKAATKDAELKIRDQIVFVNRGGSGYGEDLSAFGNDIKRKLMSFIPELKEGALVFLDEFGSTIPEDEAYYLIHALLDYLNKHNAKVYLASHNESYINWVSKNKNSGISLYNFQTKSRSDGTMDFLYKLREGKDNAHSLKAFRAEGLPEDILRRAHGGMLGMLSKQKKVELLPYRDIVSYSEEKREILKQENKGFAGLSRYNEMVKVYHRKNKKYYNVVRKYKKLGYKNRPNSYYSDEDLFFSASHPDSLDKDAPEINFDFMRYGTVDPYRFSGDPISIPEQLQSKGIHRKNIYHGSNGTLGSITTWGLTSDIKELKERQRFFEEIGNWSYKDANIIYDNVNIFKWVFANFQSGGGYGPKLDFDYQELSRFNKAYWVHLIDGIEQHIAWEGLGRVYEWFTILISMEEKLGNLPQGFREKHKQFLLEIKQVIDLTTRHRRAKERFSKRWDDDFKRSAKLAERVCEKIQETVDNLLGTEVKEVINNINVLYNEIEEHSLAIDILSLKSDKRTEVISFLDESRIFRSRSSRYSESISNGFMGMTQVIRALKGTGNLLEPLLIKLRTFDSVHASQIANYLEEFISVPDVEDFVDLVKFKRDDPEGFKDRDRDNDVNIDRDHGGSLLFEIQGLIDIANQIKKLGWSKVEYNNTGEINIKGMSHPGVEKTKSEQQTNNLHLGMNQSFDILEGATMGGKTFHIQSMQWIVRLAHSIGYVPADSASLPCFDGLVYIDRILEDEKKKLSAGQNDARAWGEIIGKIRNIVREKSEKGKYWFAIDEMISSVPARFQKGLVTALLEELTSLGQKGQISIHNPDLVSKLIENHPGSYNVRHPEVEFDENGNFDYTYKISNGRSIDKEGDFTAYSLETAEKMGLPKEIINSAREHKNIDKNRK